MGWKETWRQTVESFVRELRGPDEASGPAVAGGAGDGLSRAIAAARAEASAVERELHRTEDRLSDEESAAAVCLRRRELAERIGDRDTARVAARFQNRHEERAALLRRKRDVLRDEQSLTRVELEELLDLARTEAPPPAVETMAPDGIDGGAFRDLEERRRERAAEERLEELKRRGGRP